MKILAFVSVRALSLFHYYSAHVWHTGEFTKLCLSFGFLKYADEPAPFEPKKFIRYAVPGFIYAVNNSIMWCVYCEFD